jgi:arylsulfatase A-like enzyme
MSAKHPNFLFIITDQHRADHLGCYGNDVVKTPHMDSLAEKGLTFDKFYVASPTCTPNRATLATGRMPSATGVTTNGFPLPLDTVTLMDLLSSAGYRTALMGKAHLQYMTDRKVRPETFAVTTSGEAPPENLSQALRRRINGKEYQNELRSVWDKNPKRGVALPYYGFQEAKIALFHGDRVGGDYSAWLSERHSDPDALRGPENSLSNTKNIRAPQAWQTRVPEELYPTTWVTELTIDCLERYAKDPDKPFFIQCGYTDPHHPFTPPGKYWDMYDPNDIPVPVSLGAQHIDPPPFIRNLKTMLEDGTAIRDYVHPYAVDEVEAQQSIALTYGMTTMVDDGIGRLLAKLDDLGLSENTVVIYTSDHGDVMGDHGVMLKHGLHTEGVIRMPFIWTDPQAKGGMRTDLLSSAIDFTPSILGRAGLQPFSGVQGVNIVSAARNSFKPDRAGIIIEADELPENVNVEKFFRVRSFVDGRWRMTLWVDDDFGEMYDRQNDPHELNNLWNNTQHKETKSRLLELMLKEQYRYSELMPRPIYMG